MGKGDKKSKRGKISMGSTGVTRQKRKNSTVKVENKSAKVVTEAEETKKKPTAKKTKKETTESAE